MSKEELGGAGDIPVLHIRTLTGPEDDVVEVRFNHAQGDASELKALAMDMIKEMPDDVFVTWWMRAAREMDALTLRQYVAAAMSEITF